VRVLITGATGFVGGWLACACAQAGDEVRGWGRADVDLRDAEATRAGVRAAAPEAVYHLAALASVGRSWQDPEAALEGNQAMTLHLLEAIRLEAPGARVLVASSGEVYGRPDRLPLTEDAPLRPQSPYAVAKAACDLLAGLYADAHGLWIVRTRAFNHAGPGQSDVYAIGSFTRQAADGAQRVLTGGLDVRRDFTDVRDVVRAYRLLIARGAPGVYNVCSGHATALGEVIALLGAQARVDAARVRAHEVPEVRGDHRRLTAATGWEPEIALARTVADAVAHWRCLDSTGVAPE
jgi:GDP-4-dehydro-6-deoxy-D-mannose reductase